MGRRATRHRQPALPAHAAPAQIRDGVAAALECLQQRDPGLDGELVAGGTDAHVERLAGIERRTEVLHVDPARRPAEFGGQPADRIDEGRRPAYVEVGAERLIGQRHRQLGTELAAAGVDRGGRGQLADLVDVDVAARAVDVEQRRVAAPQPGTAQVRHHRRDADSRRHEQVSAGAQNRGERAARRPGDHGVADGQFIVDPARPAGSVRAAKHRDRVGGRRDAVTGQRVGVGSSAAVAALHDDVAAGGERRKRRPVRIGEGQGAHVGDGVVDVGDDQFEGARAGGHDALCSSASTM